MLLSIVPKNSLDAKDSAPVIPIGLIATRSRSPSSTSALGAMIAPFPY